MPPFRRAQRRRVFIKLAMTAPSGSGKTYSPLRLAFDLGARVAMLDTENGAGSLYADLGDYDVMDIEAPFSVPKYIAGICAAEEARHEDRTGRATPRKVGLAPVQRDGIEHEFSTVFDRTMDHAAAASKDRTGLMDRRRC